MTPNPKCLFIVCANPACEALKRVPSRSQQQRQRFCSRRCAGQICGAVAHLTREQRRAAALKSKRARQRRALRRLAKLSKVEVYRAAYSVGWKAGARSARRRLTITPEETPGR
jgi:hypothetical protein